MEDGLSLTTDTALPGLPGLLNMRMRQVGTDVAPAIAGSMIVRDEHLAPSGYLHGGTVVALADTACGYGCLGSLPSGKTGFTTIELKTNFLGTARVGETVDVHATAVHRGGTTQIWDAVVTVDRPGDPTPVTIAVFRCTQLLLQPR
jgi:1,4-dihydroxy-2-naphthoyl-CoA hydrolase